MLSIEDSISPLQGHPIEEAPKCEPPVRVAFASRGAVCLNLY